MAHYAEILAAQQTAHAQRVTLVSAMTLGAIVSTVISILTALCLTESTAVFRTAILVASIAAVSSALVTGLFGLRTQTRRRRTAERLMSIHEANSPAE